MKSKYSQIKEAVRLLEEHGIVETQDFVVINKKKYEEWLKKMQSANQLNRFIYQRPN